MRCRLLLGPADGSDLLLEKEPRNMQALSLAGLIEAAVAKGPSRACRWNAG